VMRRMHKRKMGLKWPRVWACCLLVLAAPVHGYEDSKVSNFYFQTDLNEALQDIALQANVNVVVDTSIVGQVTVTLDDVNFEEALSRILAGTGYSYELFADFVMVFDPKTVDAMSAMTSRRLYMPQNQTADYLLTLLPTVLRDYVTISQDNSVLFIESSSEILEKIVATLDEFDDASEVFSDSIELGSLPFELVLPTIPEALQGQVSFNDASNEIIIIGTKTQNNIIRKRIVAMKEANEASSNGGVAELVVRSVNHISPEQLLELLPSEARNAVQISEREQRISISGTQDNISYVMTLIDQIDIPKEQIRLQARVVALNQSEFLNFGTEFSFPEISAGFSRFNEVGSSLTGEVFQPWEISMGYSASRAFTNALTMNLAMLAQNNNATIVATPRAITSAGSQAEIRVTTSEYFQLVIEKDGNSTASLEQIETGTILSILPNLDDNGFITLDIDIRVSDVVARGENNLPTVVTRQANSSVTIENGGTTAIAGLLDTRTSTGNQGIPKLRDIPLLGKGFSRDSLTHDVKQVAIFVTASRVDEADDYVSDQLPQLITLDDDAFRVQLDGLRIP